MVFSFYINSQSFFGFCLTWALGGVNIGQKIGGRLTKILPARQTHFGGCFPQPFGGNTSSKKHTQNKICNLEENHGRGLYVGFDFLELTYVSGIITRRNPICVLVPSYFVNVLDKRDTHFKDLTLVSLPFPTARLSSSFERSFCLNNGEWCSSGTSYISHLGA